MRKLHHHLTSNKEYCSRSIICSSKAPIGGENFEFKKSRQIATQTEFLIVSEHVWSELPDRREASKSYKVIAILSYKLASYFQQKPCLFLLFFFILSICYWLFKSIQMKLLLISNWSQRDRNYLFLSSLEWVRNFPWDFYKNFFSLCCKSIFLLLKVRSLFNHSIIS